MKKVNCYDIANCILILMCTNCSPLIKCILYLIAKVECIVNNINYLQTI